MEASFEPNKKERESYAMASLRERINLKKADAFALACLAGLGFLVIYDSMRLGPGFSASGPQPGFFPFSLALLMLAGVFITILELRKVKDSPPFFEADQAIVDLLKVGLPIVVAHLLTPWLGLYITAGIYIAFFMAWYGRMNIIHALIAGIIFPVVLWALLSVGFNLAMPMSMWYVHGFPV